MVVGHLLRLKFKQFLGYLVKWLQDVKGDAMGQPFSVQSFNQNMDARLYFAPLNETLPTPFKVHVDNLIINLLHPLFLLICQVDLLKDVVMDHSFLFGRHS